MRYGDINEDFAIEAKCYSIDSAIGVRYTSRLISRIRNRQFGIMVTTSFVHIHAYKEIIDDKHPIIIISSRDIVHILKDSGFTTIEGIRRWLIVNFENSN